ncbi:response regulator [Bacteroidota bacterium]
MKFPIKILVADDHAMVRQGLINIIEQDLNYKVVAQSGDGSEIIGLLITSKPDIAILDVAMPNKGGLDILKDAKKASLPVKFIILTMYDDEEYFEEACKMGVHGYLLKDNSTLELMACIKAVSKDKYYISPDISGYLIEHNRSVQLFHENNPILNKFTPAEKHIIKLISENKSNHEIADDLNVSIRTVQNHRYNLCQKLNLRGHNSLFQFAIKHKDLL